MVIWPDSDSSSTNYFGHLTDADFGPATMDDPIWNGIAVGCTQLCRVHKLEPRKCVAFEGTNTGRRFYMCSVQNEVENCGFVAWVDEEWTDTAKNSLGKLWGLYGECNSSRIDERIENARLLKELTDENTKLEKKYDHTVAEVNKFFFFLQWDKFIDETCKSVRMTNYDKITEEGREKEQMELAMQLMEKQLAELKNRHRTQADVMKAKETAWAKEMEALKEEKKKLEYSLFDLFKISEKNKDKLARIGAICGE